MTDRERLDQIEQEWNLRDGSFAPDETDTVMLWLVALARRLLAVEEAARTRHHGFRAGARCPMCEALAALDEWRKEQQ